MIDMFSENLRLALTQRGVEQIQLANRTKISIAAINRYVNGERQPTVDSLILIAKALNVPYGEILTWFEDGVPNLPPEDLDDKYRGLLLELDEDERRIWVDSLENRVKKGNKNGNSQVEKDTKEDGGKAKIS